MTPTLVFDLDETLIVEEPSAVAAFEATAQLAAHRYSLDPARLAQSARTRARELWRAAPSYPYCLRVGISSWEGLWCRFEGDDPTVRALRSWAPTYRQRSWKAALADQGVHDDDLAEQLGELFEVERRRRHEVFPDVLGVLAMARQSHRLGLLTNGASCLQREKLDASGLADFFDAVVVSGDVGVGVGKPNPDAFHHVLTALDTDAREATMVGDSLTRDVDGAITAGLHAIWLNRFGRPRPTARPDVTEIVTLIDLESALDDMPHQRAAEADGEDNQRAAAREFGGRHPRQGRAELRPRRSRVPGRRPRALCPGGIAGPSGRVTSIDIDPDLARRARRSLRAAGTRATIITGDGREGHPPNAPYDRIIATAGADEIPRVWLEQLSEGGRLELPLRLDPERGAIQLIPVLERRGDQLRSVGLTWGGFMPLHGGDGGWTAPPATLSAFHSINGQHTALASLSGQGISQLSAPAARRLLVSLLTEPGKPRRRGLTDLASNHPPLPLLHLLLNIPAKQRLSLNQPGRWGIGIVDRRSQSAAIVSLRSPWDNGDKTPRRRARWRLDAYGPDTAAAELDELLSEWRELENAGQTKLCITARGQASTLHLTFAWAASLNSTSAPLDTRAANLPGVLRRPAMVRCAMVSQPRPGGGR